MSEKQSIDSFVASGIKLWLLLNPTTWNLPKKIWVLLLEICNDLPPQIKNAENLFVFKQMMKTWGGVSCKCNLHEIFSLNANTNKEIYRQWTISDQNSIFKSFMILCEILFEIWHHFYNLKSMKNIHGGMLKIPAILLKVTLPHGFFTRFLNSANVTKSRKASHVLSNFVFESTQGHFVIKIP